VSARTLGTVIGYGTFGAPLVRISPVRLVKEALLGGLCCLLVLAHRFLHERADPCLFGGGQLLQREGGRPHSAFVEVRLVAEAGRDRLHVLGDSFGIRAPLPIGARQQSQRLAALERLGAKEKAAEAVREFETFLQSLVSAHRTCSNPINWRARARFCERQRPHQQ
jgi:hypothetical protein